MRNAILNKHNEDNFFLYIFNINEIATLLKYTVWGFEIKKFGMQSVSAYNHMITVSTDKKVQAVSKCK